MRNIVRALTCFVLGALALLVLLEAVLRLLPVSTGLQGGLDAKPWPLHNYRAHRPYRYSSSWALLNAHEGTTNNYGHIAPLDFRAGSRPLIVVGDSFVESLMNDYVDSLQGILGQMLGPDHPVYGLGASGLSASDYYVLASQARTEFEPVGAVFVIEDGDISESLLRRPGGYVLRPSGSTFSPVYVPLTPHPAMQWVREHVSEPAIYGYLRGNLKFSPGDIASALALRKSSRTAPGPNSYDSTAGIAVIDWFLRGLSQQSGIPSRCIVFLMDADRYAIYDPRQASAAKDTAQLRVRFMDEAQRLGYKVVDMEPLFRTEYARNRRKFDYWPFDRHWNPVGHGLAAKAVMETLFPNNDATCMPPKAAPGS
jgi:hypothetical protein